MDCKHENNIVKDTRPTKRYSHNKQRRQCKDCGYRYTTFTLTEKELERLHDIETKYNLLMSAINKCRK